MNKPKLMIFDMDGLIFDTERLFFKILAECAANSGYVISEQLYIETLGADDTRCKDLMTERLGEHYPFEALSQAARDKVNIHIKEHGIPKKKGVIALLTYLTEQQIPCHVASSTDTATVKSYLEHAGILSFFDFIIGGDMVKESKPNPDIFLKCIEQRNCAAADAYVLEDSENGIFAAYRGGIPVICIPDLKYPSEPFAQIACTILEDLSQVIPFLS